MKPRWTAEDGRTRQWRETTAPVTARQVGGQTDRDRRDRLPHLLTVAEVADVLRTSPKAVYTMIERRQLPGVARIGKRVLVREGDLVAWLDQQSASPLGGERR